MSERQKTVWTALGIALIAFLLFVPSLPYDFLYLDDDKYTFNHPYVSAGLSVERVVRAFTEIYEGYWLPLTWTSFMLDASLWGLNPLGFRLTNLLLHALNAALVFLAFTRLTGQRGPSAVLALFFAVHPLRVESVVWIAERKDVLSGAFWFAALWAYAHYAHAPRPARMAAVTGLMALGILAKPILLMLPFALLLLDLWPLRRIAPFDANRWRQLLHCAVEKWPLFLLTLGTAWLTLYTQGAGGSVMAAEEVGWSYRLHQVPSHYILYLDKTVWPLNLAALYAERSARTMLALFYSGLLIGLVGVGMRFYRTNPCLLIGWLWFLGVMVPMSGIVRVGAVGMADRFMYLPSIGLFMMLVWGMEPMARHPALRSRVLAAGGVLMLFWMGATLHYMRFWRDNETFFQHVLSVNPHFLAHQNYGYYMAQNGRHEEAIAQFEKALAIDDELVQARVNLGSSLAALGDYERSIAEFMEVLRWQPDHAAAHSNLGVSWFRLGNIEKAEEHFRQGLTLDPAHAGILANYGHIDRKSVV